MDYLRIDNPEDLLKYQDNPKFIQNQIIEYLIYLKNPPRSLRYATRSQYLAAIITFYDLNEVVLNKKRIYRYLGEERPLENRAYSREEIAKMLEASDERVRAIILLLVSTGVRIRAIVELTLDDLVPIPDYSLYQVTIYSDSRERYSTFTTPEGAKALQTYFTYRERYGERLSPKSPVFRDQFDRNDPASVHDVKPLELRTVDRLLSRTIEKSGIRTVERITELHSEKGKIRKNVRLTAGFRKYAITQMGEAKIDLEVRKMLTGHSIGVEEAYVKYDQQYRLNQYLQCVDNLTISEESRLKSKVEELTSRTQSDEYIIKTKFQEKDDQVQRLLMKQEQFEQMLQSLIDSGQLKPANHVHQQ